MSAQMILVKNNEETVTIKTDGERYALVQQTEPLVKVIILNPAEALRMAEFIFQEEKAKIVLGRG